MRIRFLKKAPPRPGVFLFSMVYNEEWFLPHFLDHYRAIGIRHFVFYDDVSTDSTLELLLAQDDCTVVTASPGADVGNGVAIQTSLINGVPQLIGGEGAWSLSVDADELLILPSRFSSIDEVVGYLEARDLSCVLAPMIDFYPRRLSERFFDPLPLLQGCPWFDRDSPLQRLEDKPQPRMIPAGVRVRLLKRLMREAPEVVDAIYGNDVYRYAKLWKVPLLKNSSEVFRIGPHNVNVRVPDSIQLALAHFKFYPELDRRIAESLERNVHFLGAVEYRFLKVVLERYGDDSLIFRGSRKYEGPEDLERAQLMWAE